MRQRQAAVGWWVGDFGQDALLQLLPQPGAFHGAAGAQRVAEIGFGQYPTAFR